jgi:hypothetical protein
VAQRAEPPRKLKRPGGFEPPPWLWGAEPAEQQRLAMILNVSDVRVLRPHRGRGVLHGVVLPMLMRVSPLRRRMLLVFQLSFG